MVKNSAIKSLPLSSLPVRTRNILSLLNSPKIIPSDGVIKLPRDWTGLAFLVNIFSELESEFVECSDPTGKVLELWQNNDKTATVGELLQHLEVLDRYDVYDDIIEDLSKIFRTGKGAGKKQIVVSNKNYNGTISENELDALINNNKHYTHIYHAVVLYADEDKAFVAQMIKKLGDEKFQICTVEDLLADPAAQYSPVAQLISERCRRIILLVSPEFLNCTGMSFYMDYAQARSIESKTADKKILPVMYRMHKLPEDHELRRYHKLYYPTHERPVYDFWSQLKISLEYVPTPDNSNQTNGSITTPQNSIDSLRAPNSRNNSGDTEDSPLLSIGSLSASMSALNFLSKKKSKSADSQSLSNVSQASSDKKKKSVFAKLALPFTWKSKKDNVTDSDSE